MKQLLIISGKGGTGKTTLTTSFAALSDNFIMADCDVDASDLHLLLKPEVIETHDFYSGKTASINQSECVKCYKCATNCAYQAISEDLVVDPVLCEGCTLCSQVCPTQAIEVEDNLCGEWYQSETRFGPMIHASLGIAEENSGKLVTRVITEARELGQKEEKEILLIDGPPGIGCPVISSFSGTDLVLIVTEPTVSGKHDLERVITLANHFQVESLVCINKADLDEKMAEEIISYCEKEGVQIVGQIPFDKKITEAVSLGNIPVEESNSHAGKAIKNIYQLVIDELLSK